MNLLAQKRNYTEYQTACNQLIQSLTEYFPTECGQILLLQRLLEKKILNSQTVFSHITEILLNISASWDERVGTKKIFISHSTEDINIVEPLVSLLEKLGVKENQLFCSSLPAYGIPQGSGDLYDYIRNELGNANLFVIMVLSKNYYNSPTCLNEMGAVWIKQTKYQTILLPGFDFPDIKGVISPREISFRLNDKEHRKYALEEFKNRIVDYLELPPVSDQVWLRHSEFFFNTTDAIPPLKTEKNIFRGIESLLKNFTDDERIILCCATQTKTYNFDKYTIRKWIGEFEIDDVDVDNAFDMLSKSEDCKSEETRLTIDVRLRRTLIQFSDNAKGEILKYITNRANPKRDKFLELWANGQLEDVYKLYICYLQSKKERNFGIGWKTAQEVTLIEKWENEEYLKSYLSENYNKCCEFFLNNAFAYPCDWTGNGSPRGYKIVPSVYKLLTEQFDDNKDILNDVMIRYSDIPF